MLATLPLQVPEQSLSCIARRRWKCMSRRNLPAFFEPLEDSFLRAPRFSSALRSLGGEGRTCHFKSTTAKSVLANSSCVLICLNCADGEVKKFAFTSFFTFFFFGNARSCWPRCYLSLHCHRDEQGSPPACSRGWGEECSPSGCSMASSE